MTATHAIARGPGPMAGTVISRAGSVIWVRLAVRQLTSPGPSPSQGAMATIAC
jgi:hypothetical protein